jgi:hypothetical protein
MTGGEIMRSFTLTLIEGGTSDPKRIDFRAYDPVHAFDILETEAVGQTAILWEGEKRLATMKRSSAGAWRLTA